MSVLFDSSQLPELMKSFYITSGIRFVLFDSAFHEVLSYPGSDCPFCTLMKSCPETRRKCTYADRRSFEKCEKERALVVYKCHAGLSEATIPLYENDVLIGYLMFGQILENEDRSTILKNVPSWSEKYALDEQALSRAISLLTCRTTEQIRAAAQIMQACTDYIVLREMVQPENDRVFRAAQAWIEENLREDLDIDALCRTLGVGRTKLYDIFRREAHMGVAEYVRLRRLHTAKKLLRSAQVTVQEVSDEVGFRDYNYFSRVFKAEYGISPKNYQKKYR